jgi:KDO2-lipid IV(A) lauroyltransferase
MTASTSGAQLPARGRAGTGRRDLREGEAWTRLQTLKNAVLYAAARVTLLCLAPFPALWLRALGRRLGRLLYHFLPGPRRLALANLSQVFPDLSARERSVIARDAYLELGGYLGDTVALLSRRHAWTPLPIDPASRAILDAAVAEGRGVLFVSAHLGPWEKVAASLVRAGVPLTTLAREGYDPRFTKLLDKLRRRLEVPAIYRGSPGAAVRIVRTLRLGGVLGAVMDLRSRVPSISVPFLGFAAPTAIGPARIALRTGAAVVVGTAAPAPGERGTEALEITVTRIETAGLEKSPEPERELTLALNDEISRRILALPRGWVWMHPRWVPHESAAAEGQARAGKGASQVAP